MEADLRFARYLKKRANPALSACAWSQLNQFRAESWQYVLLLPPCNTPPHTSAMLAGAGLA